MARLAAPWLQFRCLYCPPVSIVRSYQKHKRYQNNQNSRTAVGCQPMVCCPRSGSGGMEKMKKGSIASSLCVDVRTECSNVHEIVRHRKNWNQIGAGLMHTQSARRHKLQIASYVPADNYVINWWEQIYSVFVPLLEMLLFRMFNIIIFIYLLSD